MTSKYDEAVFEFLTKEENFSAVCEISENFPKIKDRLIKEFWGEAKEGLKRKVNEKEKKWDIKEDFIDKPWHQMGFWFASGNIRVTFEYLSSNLLYGLWRNPDNKEKFEEKVKQYTEEIETRLKNNREMKYTSHSFLAAYKLTDYNFKTNETLKRILPHNRSEFANELADLLFELTEEIYEPIILGFEKTSL